MSTPQRGALVAEGKTKKIYDAGEPGRVVVEYKNDITAFDDPSFTKQFDKKAEYSNTINARVFELLNTAGIETAFIRKLSSTEFLAEQCTMIPLEVVARRYAVGSYLKRHPEFTQEGSIPHRFGEPLVEFFLKTTKGSLKDSHGTVLVEGLDPLKGEEDPFIPNPEDEEWKLYLSKSPTNSPDVDLHKKVRRASILPSPEGIDILTNLTRSTFLTIEEFFAKHNFKFIDLKIEFGMTHDGRLVVADVIDNDSWRLRDQNWNDVSKQSFRDGEDLTTIENKYQIVAKLLEKSRV